jgi:hypothetical protein
MEKEASAKMIFAGGSFFWGFEGNFIGVCGKRSAVAMVLSPAGTPSRAS